MVKEFKNINNPAIVLELKNFPNQGIIWEIIYKNKTGKIFELPDSGVLILENCSDPFVFVAGNLTDKSARAVINIVSGYKFPMVYCRSQYHPLFLGKGWNLHLRIELSPKNLNRSISINKTLAIKPISTIDLFKRCFWYKEKCELYGSEQNFLSYGTGYALCIDDQVVSESYASIGGDHAEIGVVTHPNYRSKGYASLIASYLIQQCLVNKITPIWSCNADNRLSFNTGIKLGFEVKSYYTLLVPNFGNVFCPGMANWLKNNP